MNETIQQLLDRHVECVRHYLHLHMGKPKPNLESAPEIALDELKSQLTAALSQSQSAPQAPQAGEAWQEALDGMEVTIRRYRAACAQAAGILNRAEQSETVVSAAPPLVAEHRQEGK